MDVNKEYFQSCKNSLYFYEDLLKLIASMEGKDYLLYTADGNPYESIYIRAKVENGCLTITDSEFEHAPGDGAWATRIIFDEVNTRRVFAFLTEVSEDPIKELSGMISYRNRTRVFLAYCEARGIEWKET